MRRLFEDCGEIDHVIDLIKEQWTEEQYHDDQRELYEMRTAKHLAGLLRAELLGDGITTPEQIADANEIVYWYLDKKVSPDMWQYVFADCLAALLIYFDKPLGVINDAREKLESSNQLNDLHDKCVRVMHADLSRIMAANIEKLAPLAEIGVKVSDGGAKGQVEAYGSRADKKAKYAEWQELIDAEIEITPKASFEAIKRNVSKKIQFQFISLNGIRTIQEKKLRKNLGH